MAPIIHLLGRVTADVQMQKAKNSETEYVTLDFAVTQRGQNKEGETIYYHCFFHSFLAQRLVKANVKKGTGLYLYGDLELKAFTHQKGSHQGEAGISANVTVKDWDFVPSNKLDTDTGANQNGNYAQNASGTATPGTGNYQNTPVPNQGIANGMPYQGNVPQGAQAQNMPNGFPPQGQNGMPNQSVPNGVYPTASTQGYQNEMQQNMGNNYANNGFANVPEGMPGQLPFPV